MTHGSQDARPSPDSTNALFSEYRVPSGHVDEVRDASGALRPQWQAFTRAAGDLTTASLAQAARRIAHQLHENGVTYNVYATANGMDRPWALDPLPLIVNTDDWTRLDAGLRQRARLLNAMAADLYGPQQLLRDGTIPPALVFDHPGFIRACHGVRPPGRTFLNFVAFDLAHTAEGEWTVVSSRTQAPSGLGYALENRSVVGRLFPDALRAVGTRAVAPFCDALQHALLSAAPCDDATPHAVLLTPGPFSETYFEHVFLAGQLGMPLVHGSDLTVRDDHVFLKTVSGLRPVHAIWRRLDDDFCDPLELRSDSALGVPGLLQAWRAGHVLVANAFGLSVLESAGLMPCLDRAASQLLGESLAIPSVPTWWSGSSRDLSEGWIRAEANGVIKPALSRSTMHPVFVHDLSPAERQVWADRLQASASRYVIQPYVPLSQVPAWRGESLESCASVLRVFLIADGQGDYTVMPGGLGRVAAADQLTVSGQRGGGSKDVWVIGPSTAAPAALDTRPRPAFVHSGERVTSSRVAEHLFWLGRYAERSENSARLLRAVLRRTTESGSWPPRFESLLRRTCSAQGLLPADDADETAPVEQMLCRGLLDQKITTGVGFNVAQTVRVASAVRDRLSSDNWRVLARLAERLAPTGETDLNSALEILDDALLALVAVGGLEMAHMTRDDGWRFLSLGRHLERLAFVGDTISDVLTEDATDEPALLEWLLDLSDSVITYRSRYLRHPDWPFVVDLLLFDERNPRSAMFQLTKLDKHVRLLPSAGVMDIVDDIESLCRVGLSVGRSLPHPGRDPEAVRTLAESSGRLAASLSDALTLRYFSHVYDVPRATVTA